MTRPASRQGWFFFGAAIFAVSAAVGVGLWQQEVSGQDRAAANTNRAVSVTTELKNTPTKTPDELRHDPVVENANSLSRAFRESAKAAMPSVVTVRSYETSKKVKANSGEMMPGFGMNGEDMFKGTPFEGQFKNMVPHSPDGEYTRTPRREGMGSGVIIDKSGIVLTNNHVVDGADKVTIHLTDGRTFTATDIKTDPQSDLAVVRFKPDSELPAAHLGNSDDLEIGDWVIAIGNPFGQEKTVTAGIISGKGRDLEENRHGLHGPKFIQTDAAINPGNSGGPLVNLVGEVVGINTAIATNTGGYEGLGFAIPINQARWVTDQLIQSGSVHRGYLGVGIGEVSDELAGKLSAPKGQGALVGEVKPGSPAADAKLQEDDIIEKFGGQTVHSSRELPEIVERAPLNQAEPMEIIRDGKSMTVNVTIKQMPQNYGQDDQEQTAQHEHAKPTDSEFKADDLGLQVADLAGDTTEAYKGFEGVVVSHVEPDSVAAEQGLRPGILIRKVGKTAVHNVQEFESALKKETLKDGILLHVRTPGGNGHAAGNGLIVLGQEK